jgi:hypothetical protein
MPESDSCWAAHRLQAYLSAAWALKSCGCVVVRGRKRLLRTYPICANLSGLPQSRGSPNPISPLDNRPCYRYVRQARPSKGRRPVTADRWGGCGSRMGLVTLIRAALGIDRPAYCRSARCWLHWCRRGSSRLDPVIPGSAARSRVEVRPSAQCRGGAPKGEGAAASIPRRLREEAMVLAAFAGRLSSSAAGRNPWCAFRRSASLLCWGGTGRAFLKREAKLGCQGASRERGRLTCFPSP